MKVKQQNTAKNISDSAFHIGKRTSTQKIVGIISILALLLLTTSCVLQPRQSNTAPSVRIVSPQDAETFITSALRISIETEDAENNIQRINIFENGQLLGEANRSTIQTESEDSSLPERWHFNWKTSNSGNYTVSAEAVDQYGQKSSDSVNFEVNVPITNPPAPPVGNSIEYQNFIKYQDLWKLHNKNSYVIDFQKICFCLPDITQPAKLRVINQSLNNATYLSGAAVNQDIFIHFYTVNHAFSLIQEAFDRDAEEIRVVYDELYGYPKSAFIDYDKRIADEELQFKFSNFAELVVLHEN